MILSKHRLFLWHQVKKEISAWICSLRPVIAGHFPLLWSFWRFHQSRFSLHPDRSEKKGKKKKNPTLLLEITTCWWWGWNQSALHHSRNSIFVSVCCHFFVNHERKKKSLGGAYWTMVHFPCCTLVPHCTIIHWFITDQSPSHFI